MRLRTRLPYFSTKLATTQVETMNSAPNVGTHRADGASGATGYLEVERTSTVAGFRFLVRECERKWLKED